MVSVATTTSRQLGQLGSLLGSEDGVYLEAELDPAFTKGLALCIHLGPKSCDGLLIDGARGAEGPHLLTKSLHLGAVRLEILLHLRPKRLEAGSLGLVEVQLSHPTAISPSHAGTTTTAPTVTLAHAGTTTASTVTLPHTGTTTAPTVTLPHTGTSSASTMTLAHAGTTAASAALTTLGAKLGHLGLLLGG